MKTNLILAMFVALLGAAGCTDPDHYPISGQKCSPDDPVHDLDMNDCVSAV